LAPDGTPGETPLVDIMSTYQKYLNINNAIITQAEIEVPKSGYDVSGFYSPASDENGNTATASLTADDRVDTADSVNLTTDAVTFSPTAETNPKGYLSGDGDAPNALAVSAGVNFPGAPNQGDYFLRLDYLPNRLFRFSGSKWVKIEDNVRTNITPGSPDNKTVRNSFANNTTTHTLNDGTVVAERQGLSKALKPKADF